MNIDKIYSYAKNPYKARCQLLISKRKSTGLKYLNDSMKFKWFKWLNEMNDIYKSIEQNYRNKKRKVLIAFDDMIADMLCNKRINAIVTELFVRRRKLSISLGFIAQSYFVVSKILD